MSDAPLSGSQISQMAVNRDLMMDAALAKTQEASKAAETALLEGNQEASEKKLATEAEENSAVGIQKKSLKLDRKKSESAKSKKAEKAQESVLVRKDDADTLADGFTKRQGNREYRIDPSQLARLAEDIGVAIREDSSLESIILTIKQGMVTTEGEPDPAIVDKAMSFLIEVTMQQLAKSKGETKNRFEAILKNLESAKLKHFNEHADKIQLAEKLIGAVDAVVGTTHQTVKDTLNRYRDIVHNPPDIQALRKFYEAKGYKAMLLELKGLNSYLGGNLKRTNIEGPELAQLRSTVVKMQGLLGVFKVATDYTRTMGVYLLGHGILVKEFNEMGQ